MTVISTPGRKVTDASSVTDTDQPAQGPAHPQTWLSRNAADKGSGESGRNTVGNRNKAGQKPPRIRWVDDEDEFSGMPEVFLRQDTQDSPRSRGLHKTLVAGVLVLSGLIATGAVLHHRSSEDLGSGLAELAKATAGGVLDSFKSPSAPVTTSSGHTSEGTRELSPEQQSRARAALSKAIQARTGQGTPVQENSAETAPPQSASQKTNRSAVKVQSRERATSDGTAVTTPNEHAAAPNLPETASRPEETSGNTAPEQRQHQLLPALLSFPGGDYTIPLSNDGGTTHGKTEITLEPFQLARTEVTRREWLACARDEACSLDVFPAGYLDEDKLDRPVTSVTLAQIETYLTWLNRVVSGDEKPFRLPTEAEWIVAARGGVRQSTSYPWGDVFSPDKVGNDYDLVPVGDAPVINGLAGIVGNAEERVSDCWGAKLRSGGCFRNLGVVRGAPPGQVNRTTAHLGFRSSRSVTVPYSTVGFRLAR